MRDVKLCASGTFWRAVCGHQFSPFWILWFLKFEAFVNGSLLESRFFQTAARTIVLLLLVLICFSDCLLFRCSEKILFKQLWWSILDVLHTEVCISECFPFDLMPNFASLTMGFILNSQTEFMVDMKCEPGAESLQALFRHSYYGIYIKLLGTW